MHGGAEGVDSYADREAKRLGFRTVVVRPDWTKYGKAAGQIRNRQMIEQADYLYAFWTGISKGTAGALKAAQKAGVDFEIIYDQPIA
jgi:hypothetical protein